MRIKNTLSGKVEEFIPNDYSHVKMYVCGPTVYDNPHIGNVRSLIVFDNLYRLLSHTFGRVTYVRNITDVDDKIMRRARQQKIPIYELTESVYANFKEYAVQLGILQPTFEPKATENIDEMIDFITKLLENGQAYATHGHVFFDVSQDFYYGCLSKKCLSSLHPGARVAVRSYKKNPPDFVLWKPSTRTQVGWDSPWGYGRPGWHIECSAMCRKHFNGQFDIHGGGQDLIFPHHENEIAQNRYYSKTAHSPSCNYWIHNGLLLINGKKMSKSLKNVIFVEDALAKYNSEIIRYFFSSVHYSKPCDWCDKNLIMAKSSLDSLYNSLCSLDVEDNNLDDVPVDAEFLDAISDDLNFPKALARMHQMATEINKENNHTKKKRLQKILKRSGSLCGLLTKSSKEWFCGEQVDKDLTSKVNSLLEERNNARKALDFAKADKIRNQLHTIGVIIEDLPDGKSMWKRIK